MPISAPGGVSGLCDPPTQKSQTGERLTAYLEDAGGALSGNTVRAVRADLERFAACARSGGYLRFPRAREAWWPTLTRWRASVRRPPCAATSRASPRAQGGRGTQPARARHGAAGPKAHAPAEGVPADAGAGADLDVTTEALLRTGVGAPGIGRHRSRAHRRQKLRHKLGDAAANPTYIFNEHGVGYRFATPGGA